MIAKLVALLTTFLSSFTDSEHPIQTSSTSRLITPTIDAFIQDTLSSWHSPAGVGLAVVQKQDDGSWITETKGYGIANEDGTIVTEDTLFAIGSNSKLFTVLAAGLLVSNESLSPRLSWDTKLSFLFPKWADIPDKFIAQHADLTDLMSHRTGFPRHDFSYERTDNLSTTLSKLQHLRLSTEFRQTWQYNNIMYNMLSYLPSVVIPSPPSFGKFVKDNILDSLGMSSTTYSYTVARDSGNLADGFTKSDYNVRKDPLVFNGTVRALPFWDKESHEDGDMIAGAGGVISSAKDMATWLKMLLSNGAHPETGEQVIPSDVIEKVSAGITVQSPKASFPELSPTVYGGAQMRGSYCGYEYIEHGGATSGFQTQVSRFPSQNLGVAVLVNEDVFGSVMHEIIKWRVADEIFGLEPVDWNERYKSIALSIPSALPDPTPPPHNTSLPSSGNFTSLEGLYRNEGYWNLELCLVPRPSVHSQSTSCKDLVGSLPHVLPGAFDDNSTIPTFVGKIDNIWLSHVKLSHFNGNTFNFTGLQSVAVLNATDEYWTKDTSLFNPSATAEFSFGEEDGSVNGFGLRGVWGAGEGIPSPMGSEVREKSEVWFKNV